MTTEEKIKELKENYEAEMEKQNKEFEKEKKLKLGLFSPPQAYIEFEEWHMFRIKEIEEKFIRGISALEG